MTCVLGCGIDIEELSRFKKHVGPDGVSSLIELVFTREEINYNLKDRSLLRFALGFSCKEAVFKAFGVSWVNSPIQWKDIELLWKDKDDLNNHEIKLHHYADKMLQKNHKLISDFEYNDETVLFKVLLTF
jgi:phosphopantetheine--protein transferase-like protein